MIAIAHITVFSVLYAVAFAFRNYWQKVERDSRVNLGGNHYQNKGIEANKLWHSWQFVIQLEVGIAIGLVLIALDYNWLQALLGGLHYGLIFWVVFDTITGWKLTGDPLYLGTTSKLDVLTKKYLGRVGTFIAKLLLVAVVTIIWFLTF